MSEHPPEAREFGRLAPVLEIRPAAVESEPDASLEPIEIQLSSFPPGAAAPWVSPAQEFSSVAIELGDLARLDFSPSGAPAQASQPATVPAPEARAFGDTADPELARPIHLQPVAIEPVRIDPRFLESLRELAPKVSVMRPSVSLQAEAPVAEPPVPERATEPLPITLHGMAAGRGKVSEVFSSALSLAVSVQLPPSTALPLRPTMVFGPAPAAPHRKPESKPEPKPEPKKEFQKQAEKTERRFIGGKGKKADAPAMVEPEPAPSPAPAPVVSRVVEPPASASKADSPTGSPNTLPATLDLGLPSLDVQSSAWAKLSTPVKIGLVLGIIAAISGIAYLVTSGGHDNVAPGRLTQKEIVVSAGLPIPDLGWIADWSPDEVRGRRISLLRGSMTLSDYRLEFKAQIESKALGWVFRGLNPKNFYVIKLEVIKPGLEPTVALVRFALINGREQDRAQIPLPLPVRVDTTYKIRFEAVGNRFTTWVQDQKIDEWNDNRIAAGGAGLYSERGESSSLQGVFNVVPLVVKN
jgi:hypothetical protein